MYGRVQPCAHGVQRLVRGDLDCSRGVRGQRQAQRPPAARMCTVPGMAVRDVPARGESTGQSGCGSAGRLGKANVRSRLR